MPGRLITAQSTVAWRDSTHTHTRTQTKHTHTHTLAPVNYAHEKCTHCTALRIGHTFHTHTHTHTHTHKHWSESSLQPSHMAHVWFTQTLTKYWYTSPTNTHSYTHAFAHIHHILTYLHTHSFVEKHGVRRKARTSQLMRCTPTVQESKTRT